MLGKMRRYLHEYQSAVGKRPEAMAGLVPVADSAAMDTTPAFDADQVQADSESQTDSPEQAAGNSTHNRRPGSVEQSSAAVS